MRGPNHSFDSEVASAWAEKLPKWLKGIGSLPDSTHILSSQDLALIAELTADYIVPSIWLEEPSLKSSLEAYKQERREAEKIANEARKVIQNILFSALTHANPQHSVSKESFTTAFDSMCKTLFFGPIHKLPVDASNNDANRLRLLAKFKGRSEGSVAEIKQLLDALNKQDDFLLTDSFKRALILTNEFRLPPNFMFDFAKSLKINEHYSDSKLLCNLASCKINNDGFYLKVLEHPFCDSSVIDALLKNPHCSQDCKKQCENGIRFKETLLRRINTECCDVRTANYALGYGNALQVEDKLHDAISKSGTVAQMEKLITDYCERRPYMSLASHLLGVIELKPSAPAPQK